MRKYHSWVIKKAVILFIFACTISCTGKKDVKNEATETAVSESKAPEPTMAVKESNWLINADFGNVIRGDTEDAPQVDYENRTLSQSVKDLFSPYNLQFGDNLVEKWDSYEKAYRELRKIPSIIDGGLILKSVQPAKIPTFNRGDGWSAIAFFADFRSLNPEKHTLSGSSAFYLLIFFEKDGMVRDYDFALIDDLFYAEVPISNAQYNIEYNWIKDMPLKRFEDISVLIGDFNNDDYDEIMLFGYDRKDPFGGSVVCYIYGYTDENKKGMGYKPIFEAPIRVFLSYNVKTWDYGPPVQFGTYKGIEGFIIYEKVPTGETAKQYVGLDPDEPFFDDWYEEFMVYEGIWNFYTWDKEGKKYVLVDRVNPDEIKTQWSGISKFR